MIRIIYLTTLLLASLLAALASPSLAQDEDTEGPPPVAGEQEITQGVRSGRLGRDELIAKGKELSYFQKLRLYYYAQELEPYFGGVEDAIRDLARTSPEDGRKIADARLALYQAMERSYKRLAAAKRPGLDLEWHRGLTGLIYLDYDWRDRVYEQKKDEIKNPYDLVALLDCLDAKLRGLTQQDLEACPALAGATGEKQP
ncbi:MAG: hypothetical protein KQI62_18850 [Deltaproteobacteria bacterium]|nr:hypothetical protein [Deltaproteobacteria bacterium]